MSMILYEKAKQAVADKWNRSIDLILHGSSSSAEDIDHFYRQVSEWVANEAVSADRNDVLTESYYDRYHDHVAVRAKDISDRPLPFPQQPDER